MPEIIEDVEWLKIPKNGVNSRKIKKFSGCSYLTNRRGYECVLGSGEINHSGSGENRQFWSNENHQSGVASPQVVLFTRPAAGQPVSQ